MFSSALSSFKGHFLLGETMTKCVFLLRLLLVEGLECFTDISFKFTSALDPTTTGPGAVATTGKYLLLH